VAKKDIEKKDDLELDEKDAAAVKGGVHRNVHKNVHSEVHKSVHKGPGVNRDPHKT